MVQPTDSPVVLADACILVKDVVSCVFYDLHAAGLIQLYWTPEIEAEYITHRARLRAQTNCATSSADDLVWAANRIETIKKYLVTSSTPPDWMMEETLEELSRQSKYTTLQAMKDKDDIHVATAAGYLADKLGRPVVLVSDNLNDLPEALLSPLSVLRLHQGELLEMLYRKQPVAVSRSVLRTAGDFKNPVITPAQMVRSIASRNQFYNPDLAGVLAKEWDVSYP